MSSRFAAFWLWFLWVYFMEVRLAGSAANPTPYPTYSPTVRPSYAAQSPTPSPSTAFTTILKVTQLFDATYADYSSAPSQFVIGLQAAVSWALKDSHISSNDVNVTSVAASGTSRIAVVYTVENVNVNFTAARISLTAKANLATGFFNTILQDTTGISSIESYAISIVNYSPTLYPTMAPTTSPITTNMKLLAGAVVGAIFGCIIVACCGHFYHKWATRPASFGQETFSDVDAGFGKALHVVSRGWDF